MKSMKKDCYKKGWTSAMAKIMEIIAKETKGKSYHKQEMRRRRGRQKAPRNLHK